MSLNPVRRQFIADTEVLVWDLDLAEETTADASNVLPACEIQRALKARNPILQRRRLAGRILIRRTLSGLIGQRPEVLAFERAPYGKPFLPSGPSFNISHSGKYLALAIRTSGRVGVDIEVMRDSPDLPTLARRYFTESEQRAIAGCREGVTQGFFRVWVRKEALLKATGFGLTLPLDSFSVSAARLLPGANALNAMEVHHEHLRDWLITSVNGPSETVCALALDSLG